MIEWLAKRLIPDYRSLDDPRVRRDYGALCGGVGVALNLLLALAKFLAGRVAGSIAIMADASNNLSDAGTSLVTLLGFRLSGKRDDDEHPFGHGRAEYVAGLIVALLVILMGLDLGRSAIARILSPEPTAFHPLAAGVLAAAVAVKLGMFRYNRRVGEKIKSVALRAAALDSVSDACATLAVLAAMLAERFFGWNIDGWVGALVALMILRGGIEAARDAVSPLLGNPPEADFVARVEAIARDCELVLGVHDLRVHDYGAGKVMISLHAEVPADRDLMEVHDAVDGIERRLNRELNCEAVIHIDPVDRGDARAEALRERVLEALRADVDPRLTVHDFRATSAGERIGIRFDAVLPHDRPESDEDLRAMIVRRVEAMDPRYTAQVNVDRPYSAEDMN